jgi:hypothetical protein
MDRSTFVFVAATVFSAATVSLADRAAAQAPASTAAAPAPANPKLAGTWEGTFTTDGPSGGMIVTLKAGTPWSVANALTGEVPPPAEPREVTPDGDKIVWKQLFGEYDVVFKGTLSTDGTKMTGVLEAYQGGAYAAGGSFSLARKS